MAINPTSFLKHQMHKLLLSIVPLLIAAFGHADGSLQVELEKADEAYYRVLEEARADYRQSLSKAIESADMVEIFLLDFETASAEEAGSDSAWDIRLPKGQFPIIPYGATAKVLDRKKLTPEEWATVAPSLKVTVAGTGSDKESSAMCHFPVHGIRLWSNDEIAFQTSICYVCRNFYIKYPMSDAEWMVLTDPNFRKAMERLMPIPKELVDRFGAKRKRNE